MSELRIEAVYEDGVLKPTQPLNLAEHTSFRITIEPVELSKSAELQISLDPFELLRNQPVHITVQPVDQAAEVERRVLDGWYAQVAGYADYWGRLWSRIEPLTRRSVTIPRVGALTLEGVLAALAIVVYVVTRFWALDRFPIYFFSDEAIHATLAEDLIRNRFRDGAGTLFPTYFKNYQVWNLSLSVYVHAISVGLFGKSIFVTRATSALVSLFGTVAVGLILKLIFKVRFWWIGVLMMAVTPAWFLHSRTAFETVMMVSFYALFLLFYLLYRYRSPRFLYAAIVFAAATFYAYSNGQAVIGITGLVLALSDIRYHLRHWRTVLAGVVLVLLMAIPYVRFRLDHPTELAYHLRVLDSYWLRDMPLGEKVARYVKTYLYGLSPQYWFFPNEKDLVRHRMKGFNGHLQPELLPFFAIGLGICLWRWRSSAHRTVVLAVLSAPFAAAMVGIGITRVLAFVVPAGLLASLGLVWTLDQLRSRVPRAALGLTCFVLLSGASLWMLRDALVNGPLWYSDYGLYGMQYGAKQIFDVVPEYLERDPATKIIISPTWANGADLFPRFFLADEDLRRVRTGNIDAWMLERRPLNSNVLFVMTGLEYEKARSSGKFKSIQVERVIPYPDRSSGFYFARLTYAEGVDAIFEAEREARRQLVATQLQIGGQLVQVRHSLLDGGRVNDMFDGDWFTLGRGMEANPLIVELNFPQPRAVSGLAGDFGSMDFQWTIYLYPEGEGEPEKYSGTYRGTPPDPHAEISFDRGPQRVSRMRIEIKDIRAGNKAKIHVRELALR